MITKMLIEIFQAIIEDTQIKRLLGFYEAPNKQNTDIETLMNELGLNAKQKEEFRKAYKEYEQNPSEAEKRYKYKYEPKSNSAADKFDAYYQKFEDKAKETGDYRHREYAKYYQNNQNQQQQNTNPNPYSATSAEEKKHADALEIGVGITDFEVIKTAYKTQMKKYHPDKFSEEDKKKHAEALSMRINAAYDFFKKKFNK
ncbi:MAG: J domain-containing protein [Bacteroidetes bacterium]|nr:MAG: J domain-containing protein [Bacteroidota bacterium]TAG87401.1 MAG: J domain-containing protein [Bacteroidota bacterium]